MTAPKTLSATSSLDRRMKESPLALTEDGRLFLRLEYAGFSALIAAIDGLSLTFFDDEKKPYLNVDTVIEWHEKELKYQPKRPHSRQIINKLKQLKQKAMDGTLAAME